MSDTVPVAIIPPPVPQAALPTAVQKNFSFANIAAHNGSTFAGVGVALLAIGHAMQTSGIPNTGTGWVVLLAGIATALAASFGK